MLQDFQHWMPHNGFAWMTIPALTFWGFKPVEKLCKVKKLERGGRTHQKSLNMRSEFSRLHYCEQISHCYYFFLVTIKITLQPTQLCAIYRDQIIIKMIMLQAAAMTFFSPSFSGQLSENIVITFFFVSHSPWCYRIAYFH